MSQGRYPGGMKPPNQFDARRMTREELAARRKECELARERKAAQDEQSREERVRERHARGDWISPATREEYGLPNNQAAGG